MRKKFTSKQEEEKIKKRNQYIIGIVLIIVMSGSILGMIAGSFGVKNKSKGEQVAIFKGIDVVKQDSFYVMQIASKNFAFSVNPATLEDILPSVNTTKRIYSFIGKPLYIDSTDYYSAQELGQNLQDSSERMQRACLNESDCEDKSLPIKDCSNNIIIIRASNESKVYENQSCVFIEGKQEDLIKLTDAFLLKVSGLN